MRDRTERGLPKGPQPPSGPGRPEGRYTQAERCIRLLDTLRAEEAVLVCDLALRAGVHERSIRRDLAALVRAGVPVVLENGVAILDGAPAVASRAA